MQNEQFDAVIVGAGQGGTPLSRALAQHGWRTALIECRALGGTCLNDGCVPTKTYVASARVAALARRGAEFGVLCGDVSVDLRRVKERKDALLVAGRKEIGGAVAKLDKLELLFGTGCFAEEQPGNGESVIEVQMDRGEVRRLQTPRVFLDVGSRAQVPEIAGLETVPYLTNTSILDLEEVPRHLLILGGGYIALEFAQMFRRFGADVTVVQKGASLLAEEDDDIVACLTGILRSDGIDVRFEAEPVAVGADGAEIAVRVRRGGSEETVRGSHVLVATGRVPNTEALYLERVGLTVTEKGTIAVNERLETARAGVWALGDVKGGPAFTHVSHDDFRILRANLLEGKTRSTKDRLIPYCIFTDPELGRVGLTEKTAWAAGYDVQVATLTMEKVSRAREMAELRGMLKAVVDRKTRKVLGVAMLCVDGGEVATQMQFAMLGGLTAEQIEASILAHPVLAEGLHPLFRGLK